MKNKPVLVICFDREDSISLHGLHASSSVTNLHGLPALRADSCLLSKAFLQLLLHMIQWIPHLATNILSYVCFFFFLYMLFVPNKKARMGGLELSLQSTDWLIIIWLDSKLSWMYVNLNDWHENHPMVTYDFTLSDLLPNQSCPN